MVSRPASATAGGGRWVTVSAERLAPWLAGFAAKHGVPTVEGQSTYRAPDGAVAEVEVPYPPLTGDLVQHVLAVRTVGVLLVRRGGHAAGVFLGDTLVASKVGSRHVQGRTAAGGWSQQRFARRRAGQTSVAVHAAADDAAPVLLGRPLDALRLGGDRTLADEVLTDPRLAPLQHLVTGARLDVPDPRLVVLKAVRVRDVRIRIVEPD
ncbi:MAG: hypothetical protein JWL64_2733 [Frankiales bacterium]|nr:hypothetical protein [Frankiales bacterium]